MCMMTTLLFILGLGDLRSIYAEVCFVRLWGGGVFVTLIRLRFSDIRLQMGYVRSRMTEKGKNLKN